MPLHCPFTFQVLLNSGNKTSCLNFVTFGHLSLGRDFDEMGGFEGVLEKEFCGVFLFEQSVLFGCSKTFLNPFSRVNLQ